MEGSHVLEEVVGSSNYDNHDDYNRDHDQHNNKKMIIKRKRTKRRQRPSSPASLITSSASSGGNYSFSTPTSPSSGEATEEEEDMANCLILLAQGHHNNHKEKLMINVYECKTCNRTFPSFQALGGHRASHKKPKTVPLSKESLEQDQQNQHHDRDQHQDLDHRDHQNTLVCVNKLNNTTNKIHECSICGSEFTSGQALGGHMRRHRATLPLSLPSLKPISTAGATPNLLTSSSSALLGHDDVDATKRRGNNILPLDLNLPAPEDDIHRSNSESKFAFVSPVLVDCHY